MDYKIMKLESERRAEDFIDKYEVKNKVAKEEIRSIYSFMTTAYSLGLRKPFKEFLKEVIRMFGILGTPLEEDLEDFDQWYKKMRKATGDWINELWSRKIWSKE